MWFPAALIASVAITLASIFGFYKIFLDKPGNQPTPVNQTISTSPAASPLPQPSQSISTFPAKSSTPSPKSTTKPAASSAITVLESNLPSPSPLSRAISGTITLAGSAPSGSSFVIAARPTGSGEQFKVVIDGITAQNNASWSWSQAQDGVRYDLFAVLKGKSGSVDIDYASSPSSTVTAPYQGQVFVVDAGYALSAPTGTASVNCTTHLSNNSWNTTVTYPAVTGAKMYHVQIGTTSGGNDLLDVTLNAQSVTPNLNDSVNYYFRYSVASVSYPTAYQYSAFSTPQSIRCP